MAATHETPEDLKYTKEHEWIRTLDGSVEIGITAFAADQLGDVVFVELPEVGAKITAGQPFGVVESVKSVSDLYAPINGTVSEINEGLLDAPELVNEASYGEGWIIKVKPETPQELEGLLSAAGYKESLD
ncbi:MAG: glycine cleavage system protein GcvH [Magnetococcales bacterium]|nr:glycine cleavage system protein GcvH [Magnetococcales bacterium]